MSASLNQGTATIYQFPVGGRASLGGRRYGETKSVQSEAARVSDVVCTGSWYHEEAIHDANPGFKPSREH
jgi:hypothetical protein